MPEDDLTFETILAMKLELRNIARQYWSNQQGETAIARREGLTRAKVRTRIHWIREQVANKTLM